MLIPKESSKLVSMACNSNMQSATTESTEGHSENAEHPQPFDNIIPINITNLKASETAPPLVNGNLNGEVRPPTKCMNIIQNILIKKEDHEHTIQIPIKREIDEDTLNNRIKIPRKDNPETANNVSIKEEVLDIKSEITELAGVTSTDVEIKPEVQTCFSCNMLFVDKKAFYIHSRKCGKPETTFIPDDAPSSSCNNPAVNHTSGKTNNYMIHLEQLPRLIETIRSTQCLYNTNIDGYNNLDLKEQMWSRIAVNCNFANAKTAKGAWKKLLEEYCDSLNKRRSGNVNELYRYEQQMQFMLPYINNNLEHSIPNDDYSNSYSSLANYTPVTIPDEIIEDVDDAQSVIHLATPAKRPRISTPYVVRHTELELPRPTQISARAVDLFFMSMCESAKALPYHLQLQVKKKVFECIMEAEEIVHRVNPIRNEPFSPPPSPGDEQFQY